MSPLATCVLLLRALMKEEEIIKAPELLHPTLFANFEHTLAGPDTAKLYMCENMVVCVCINFKNCWSMSWYIFNIW